MFVLIWQMLILLQGLKSLNQCFILPIIKFWPNQSLSYFWIKINLLKIYLRIHSIHLAIAIKLMNITVFNNRSLIFYCKFYVCCSQNWSKLYNYLAKVLDILPIKIRKYKENLYTSFIKIGKFQENLDISNIQELWSISDYLNLRLSLANLLQGFNVTGKFQLILMKSIFFCIGI